MSNEAGTPLNVPQGYDLGLARTCSFVVNVACDMCEQWKSAGMPSIGNFTWQPNDSCSITGSVFDLADFTFSGPVWSTFTTSKGNFTEPFAILAQATAEPTTFYLAFRGSQTDADEDMDARIELADYTPPTATSIADIHVEQGFSGVFGGFGTGEDGLTLTEVFTQVASVGGTLIVTGHSLGSTLATLTVPLACSEKIPSANLVHYNQASPKVGDANFQAYYDSLDVPTFRLVNTFDVVPKTPPGKAYVAVGVEADFGAGYLTELQCHDPCCSYSYALFNPTSPYNPTVGTCMDTSQPELRIP
jgi:hypothetical protein